MLTGFIRQALNFSGYLDSGGERGTHTVALGRPQDLPFGNVDVLSPTHHGGGAHDLSHTFEDLNLPYLNKV